MSNKKILLLIAATALILTGCKPKAEYCNNSKKARQVAQFKKKIKHIIVIYEENWSFDGMFGDFPGCNNLSKAGNIVQLGRDNKPLRAVRQPTVYDGSLDPHFNGVTLPLIPYDLLKYIGTPAVKTGDMTHAFYTEQLQIDTGRMDKFMAWGNNPGLVMSYINLHDTSNLINKLEWKLAGEYTLCDNFFHSAFGGSFLNHQWLIAAATPEWKDGPENLVNNSSNSDPDPESNPLSPDKYVVNTTYSNYWPNHGGIKIPLQTRPTIGDRMLEAKPQVSWAWYAGGWDRVGKSDGGNDNFQYHHQPFTYFANFQTDHPDYNKCLKDETKFFIDLKSKDSLPKVCFVKPCGRDNEHPGYSDLWEGMEHLQRLYDIIKASPYWGETVIIVVSDEHGGRWDHVAPPKIDRWGPGTRIPALIISPYAKKHNVDHTQYETVSILRFIETRFDLAPLTLRDAQANDLLDAFDFK